MGELIPINISQVSLHDRFLQLHERTCHRHESLDFTLYGVKKRWEAR